MLTGFAGAGADAFALLERFEAKLKDYPGERAAGGHRAGQGVADRPGPAAAGGDDGGGRRRHTLLVTGNGDVIQPTDGVLGIGSGGNYAVAAARALVAHSTLDGGSRSSARSLEIAAGIDVYQRTSWWRKWRAK